MEDDHFEEIMIDLFGDSMRGAFKGAKTWKMTMIKHPDSDYQSIKLVFEHT